MGNMWGTGRDSQPSYFTLYVEKPTVEIFIYLRTKRVRPGNFKGLLNSWNKDGHAAKKEGRRKIIPACISWTVWKEKGIGDALKTSKATCRGLK